MTGSININSIGSTGLKSGRVTSANASSFSGLKNVYSISTKGNTTNAYSTVYEPYEEIDYSKQKLNDEVAKRQQEYLDIIDGKIDLKDLKTKKGDFWYSFKQWCNSNGVSNYGENSTYIESKFKTDFYCQYINAGYTEEQIKNIEKYPSIDNYMPDKKASEYSNENNMHETLKIDNIPCSSEEKQRLKELQNNINNLKKYLDALYSAKSDFHNSYMQNGAYGSPLAEEYYQPNGSDKYYYLPPNGICKTLVPKITGISGGTPTTSGYTYTVSKNNYAAYEANVDIDIADTKEVIELSENVLFEQKKDLIIKDYEKVVNTKEYQDFIKNINPDKIVNYHKETVDNIIGLKYGTPIIDGKKDVMVATFEGRTEVGSELYEHMTIEQKNIYCYYLKGPNGSVEKANKYIDSTIEKINYKIAADHVVNFKKKLRFDSEEHLIDDLKNIGLIDTKAVSFGLADFFINTCSIFTDKSKTKSYMKSVYDYEKLLILDFIATQKPEWAKRYKVFEKIGQYLFPGIIAVGVACTGHGTAATRLFSMLTSLSNMGKTIRENAQKGYSGLMLYADGAAEGISQFTIKMVIISIVEYAIGIDGNAGKAIVEIMASTSSVITSDWLKVVADNWLTGKPIDFKGASIEIVEKGIQVAVMAAIAKGVGLSIKLKNGETLTLKKENVDEISNEIAASSPKKDVITIILECLKKVKVPILDDSEMLNTQGDITIDMVQQIAVNA